MTKFRTLEDHAVVHGLMLKLVEINALALFAGYLDALEARKNREAVEAAEKICQERMMNGVYGNDADAMARDLESETELQKMLRKTEQ